MPIATALLFFGFAAGAKGDHWFWGGMIGAGIMSIFWIPVLWTAWKLRGPMPGVEESDKRSNEPVVGKKPT